MVPMSNREVTGSLFERNGRYTAVLNLYDKNGKRRQMQILFITHLHAMESISVEKFSSGLRTRADWRL